MCQFVFDVAQFVCPSFSPEKNEKLIAERNISFEEIEQAIDNGFLLDVINHPKRTNQVSGCIVK